MGKGCGLTATTGRGGRSIGARRPLGPPVAARSWATGFARRDSEKRARVTLSLSRLFRGNPVQLAESASEDLSRGRKMMYTCPPAGFRVRGLCVRCVVGRLNRACLRAT